MSAKNTMLPRQSPNPQGPPEGPQLPTASRVGGPRPLSDSSAADPSASSFSELVPKLFAKSSWSQNMAPRARARHLWLLLRAGLHDFVEKVRLSHGIFLEASFLVQLFP